MTDEADSEPFNLDISDSIDLHAFHPRDIEGVVRAYLQEAHRKRFTIVRIIHGKGVGIQREVVRRVLSDTAFVSSFKSGDEFSGGWGATIAQIEVENPG